jgi:hypothetical protein
MAGKLGRSVSKRFIMLAAKCCALAAEVPLPQQRILLPLSRTVPASSLREKSRPGGLPPLQSESECFL